MFQFRKKLFVFIALFLSFFGIKDIVYAFPICTENKAASTYDCCEGTVCATGSDMGAATRALAAKTSGVAASGAASPASSGGASGSPVAFCNPLSGDCTGVDGRGFDSLITGIINFIFGLALIVCPALIIWGAFLVATSGGSEDKMKSGRQIITYAIIGLVVIALANVAKAIILDIVNTK